ncbi:unnamed protein product [Symbiodinium microadriaticum]|nr:unnamed protein product [Symbiodinium microadriaticum]CAE7938058.1 unnamed protein product [Symbiodinium sp. KB8]
MIEFVTIVSIAAFSVLMLVGTGRWRSELLVSLFNALGGQETGYLGSQQLFRMAQLLGFEGGEEARLSGREMDGRQFAELLDDEDSHVPSDAFSNDMELAMMLCNFPASQPHQIPREDLVKAFFNWVDINHNNRMVKFGEDELCSKDAGGGDEGYEDSEEDYEESEEGDFESLQGFRVPDPVPRSQISTVHLDEQGVHGHSLSGEVLFEMERNRLQAELFTAGMLLELISEETGCEDGVLLRDGRELSTSDPVGDGTLTLKQTIRDCRPLLCRKIYCRNNPGLGREAVVRPELRDVLEPVQALKECRTWVTRNHKGEGYRHMCWLVYSKREVISYGAGLYEPLKPFGYFPQAPCWKLPAGTRQWGGARSDVWSTCLHLPVRQLLDEHAAVMPDRPIPRYQMIVDPNQFVHQTRDGPAWVPCEFGISADGTVSLVGGLRSHLYPQLAQHVARPVLAAALPLLAKLRRPQLLLDGRRLQVVFKAQRILVPGDTGDNSDAEYVGLWHVDGHRENVAAVVLYYYHVDPSLRGGDMEFCGREPMDVVGYGDCRENIHDLGSKSLQQALRAGSKNDKSSAVHNCRVPIGEGTMMVFSNYQMAHRVLRLKNTGSTEASRDFVALFLLDPSAPALLPARSILAGPHLLRRTLAPARVPDSAIKSVLEFLGVWQTDGMRKRQRNRLLSEQLKPSGEFACGGDVYATGNGCFTMIGWLHNMLENRGDRQLEDINPKGFERLAALNLPPEGSDRGLSEVLIALRRAIRVSGHFPPDRRFWGVPSTQAPYVRLGSREILRFAKHLGFDGDPAEWEKEYAYMVRRYGWSQKGCDLFQFSRLVTDEAGLCYLDDAALQAVSLEIYALCDVASWFTQRHQGLAVTNDIKGGAA